MRKACLETIHLPLEEIACGRRLAWKAWTSQNSHFRPEIRPYGEWKLTWTSFSICLLELTTWLKRRSNLCRCRRRKCRGHWKWRIVHIHLLTFFVLNGYLDQKNDLCHNETWFGNVVWLFWALAIKDSGQKCDTESTTSQPNSSPVKAGVKERTVTQAIQTKWSLIGEDLIT